MRKQTNRNTILAVLLSAFIFLAILITIIGTAYARYQENISQEVNFMVRNPGELTVTSENGWEWIEEEGLYQCVYQVKQVEKTTVENLYYKVQLATTMGIGMKEEEAVVTLSTMNANGVERQYQGNGESFKTDSLYYEEIGSGYLYQFYNQMEQEYLLTMDGTGSDEKQITIKVHGADEITLMELIITETQQED